MQCPKCKVEAGIVSSRYEVRDDDTAEQETKLYIAQDFVCRNAQCGDYQKIIYTKKNPLQLSKATDE